MRVTVKEAAQMLCPFIRDWDYDRNASEGSPPIYEHIKCRSSVCMAWRWELPNDEAENQALRLDKRRGFCGMTEPGP